jgi:hypothetical protein
MAGNDALRRQILDEIRQLSPSERRALLQELLNLYGQGIGIRPMPRHSLLELEGLGAEIWEGIDAQEYVNEERRSWNKWK